MEPNGPTGTGGAGNTGGQSGQSGSNATCDEGPGYASEETPQSIRRVTGKLVDAAGAPLSSELVQVCGLDVCVSGKTAADGGISIQTDQLIRRPALKFGEGLGSARFAWLLPKDEPEIDVGNVHGVRLPPLSEGVPLRAGATAEQGGLSLSLAPGATIDIDRLTFQTPSEQGLRAVRIPLAEAPQAVPTDLGLELLYAASPTETRFCPPAQLSIENSEGWEAGTEVDIYLHGVGVEQEFAPYGGFAKISEARVSDDGQRLETTAAGLAILGVLGFKRR